MVDDCEKLKMVERGPGVRHLGVSSSAPPDVVSSHKPWVGQQHVKPRARVVRIQSPMMLPPSWGQVVAPPPTPHFTPHTSPGSAGLVVESEAGFYSTGNELFMGVGTGEVVDRRHQLQQSLQRRSHRRHHRRLRSSGSSTSRCSSSRCPNLCHQNCLDDDRHTLGSQSDMIVYAYTFDGDVIDRRPLMSTRSDLGIVHDGQRHCYQPEVMRSQPNLIVESQLDERPLRRGGVIHRPPFYDNDLQSREQSHRPPHNSLSSSPLGGGTTTASGSVSPALSPILNIGEEVTRLTTSPVSPQNPEVS